MDQIRVQVLRMQRNRATDDLAEAQVQIEGLRIALGELKEQRDGMSAAIAQQDSLVQSLTETNVSLSTRLEEALAKLAAAEEALAKATVKKAARR